MLMISFEYACLWQIERYVNVAFKKKEIIENDATATIIHAREEVQFRGTIQRIA